MSENRPSEEILNDLENKPLPHAAPLPPRDSRRMIAPAPAALPKPPKEEQPPAVWPVWALKLRQDYEAKLAEKDRKINELEMAIVNAKNAERRLPDQRALTLYGQQGAMTDALAMVSKSPKFKDLNENEHKYVAAVALATGLHPEWHIHAFKSGGKLVVTPDYKALFQLALKEYHVTRDRRLNAEEMLARGISQKDIDEGAIAVEVQVIDLKKKILCDHAGVEYPPTVGYGIWLAMKDETKEEDTGEKWPNGGAKKKKVPTGNRIPNDTANGRDGAWMAWKAASRAALNQIADLRLKYTQPVSGAQVVDEDTFVFDAPGPVVEGPGASIVVETTAENEQPAE